MKNNFENLTLFIEKLNTIVDKYIAQPNNVTAEEVEFVNIWQLEMAKAMIKDTSFMDSNELIKVAKIILAYFDSKENMTKKEDAEEQPAEEQTNKD